MVNAQEQIEKFKDFIEKYYGKQIYELSQTGKNALILDFRHLAQEDPELSDELLSEPEETIHAAKVALEQFDLANKDLKVRFFGLPDSQRVRIRDLRSEHL